MTRNLILPAASALALTLAACGGASDAPAAPAETAPSEAPAETSAIPANLAEVSAGTYSLEKTHAFLTFKVGHATGISAYRVNFANFDADLAFDPADVEASKLSVTVDPASIATNYNGDYKAGHADSGFETWDEDLAMNERWLNAGAHPEITFVSTSATKTSDTSGTVTGDLTFLGQTKPVTLDVTYNGNANAPWFGERDLIGFNASTTLNRTDWGMTAAAPYVGEEVTVEFTGEFLQDE